MKRSKFSERRLCSSCARPRKARASRTFASSTGYSPSLWSKIGACPTGLSIGLISAALSASIRRRPWRCIVRLCQRPQGAGCLQFRASSGFVQYPLADSSNPRRQPFAQNLRRAQGVRSNSAQVSGADEFRRWEHIVLATDRATPRRHDADDWLPRRQRQRLGLQSAALSSKLRREACVHIAERIRISSFPLLETSGTNRRLKAVLGRP